MEMASNLAGYHQSSPVTTKPQAIESFHWSPARLGQTLSAVVRALDEVGEAAEGLLLSHDESMKVFVVFQVHFVICTMVVQSFVNAKQVTSTCFDSFSLLRPGLLSSWRTYSQTRTQSEKALDFWFHSCGLMDWYTLNPRALGSPLVIKCLQNRKAIERPGVCRAMINLEQICQFA